MAPIDKVLRSLDVDGDNFLLISLYPQEIGFDKTCTNAFLLMQKSTGYSTLIWVYDTEQVFFCQLVDEYGKLKHYIVPDTEEISKIHVDLRLIEIPLELGICGINSDGIIVQMPSWYAQDTGVIYLFCNIDDLPENVFVGVILFGGDYPITIIDRIRSEYPYFDPNCIC